MTDKYDKDIAGLFVESFGPDDGLLLWSRNPKREADANNIYRVTDTKDNESVHISPKQALLLLEYLTKHRAGFEKAIVEDALGRFRHYP